MQRQLEAAEQLNNILGQTVAEIGDVVSGIESTTVQDKKVAAALDKIKSAINKLEKEVEEFNKGLKYDPELRRNLTLRTFLYTRNQTVASCIFFANQNQPRRAAVPSCIWQPILHPSYSGLSHDSEYFLLFTWIPRAGRRDLYLVQAGCSQAESKIIRPGFGNKLPQ